jgi:hypothetical protein
MRGRNQALPASGVSPRRAKTKPNLASADAMRMSIGSARVMPTPTAGPLIAAIDGLVQLNIASMKLASLRPPSGAAAPRSPKSLAPPSSPKAPEPPEMSAPAQKPRPAPVTTIARTESSSLALLNACESSRPICAV